MSPMNFVAFLIVAIICVVSATPPTNGTLALGQPCNPSSSQCAPGVSCYAVNSMEIPTCGSIQGTCTSSFQCATNECVSGFCSGPLLPSIGFQCTPTFLDSSALPCKFGADCYAVNSMLLTVCGNFQSSCTWDGQCAFNKCQGGFCAGELLSPTTSYSSTSYTSPSSPYYRTNYTSAHHFHATGTGGTSSPTRSTVYVNGTATRGTSSTTTVVVVGPTTTPGGVTTFEQGPTKTASVQSGGAGKAAGGVGALGLLGVVMMML